MTRVFPDTVKAILLCLFLVLFGLNRLSQAFPHIAWLQVFRFPVRQMSDEQKAKRRRSANRLAGLQMAIAGLVLPFLYFVSTVMLFNEPKTIPLIIVSTCSVLCIGLGIWILVRNF